MTSPSYETIVKSAVSATLSIPENTISRTSFLVRDLGAQSIDFLDLTFEIEQRLGQEVNFLEILRFSRGMHDPSQAHSGLDLSIGAILGYLEKTYPQEK